MSAIAAALLLPAWGLAMTCSRVLMSKAWSGMRCIAVTGQTEAPQLSVFHQRPPGLSGEQRLEVLPARNVQLFCRLLVRLRDLASSLCFWPRHRTEIRVAKGTCSSPNFDLRNTAQTTKRHVYGQPRPELQLPAAQSYHAYIMSNDFARRRHSAPQCWRRSRGPRHCGSTCLRPSNLTCKRIKDRDRFFIQIYSTLAITVASVGCVCLLPPQLSEFIKCTVHPGALDATAQAPVACHAYKGFGEVTVLARPCHRHVCAHRRLDAIRVV